MQERNIQCKNRKSKDQNIKDTKSLEKKRKDINDKKRTYKTEHAIKQHKEKPIQ